jgi:predicted sulfurtransferase
MSRLGLAALCLTLAALPAAALLVDPAPPPPKTADEVPRMEAKEVMALLARKEAVLVDVRAAGAFAVMHAEGALSIPEENLDARLQDLPKDKLIAAYCT